MNTKRKMFERLNHVISRAIATATAIAMSGGDKWLCFEIYY